jgi:hypothetical protein
MKMMMKLFTIVALLAMTASCVTTTTTPAALPEKYNLNELKAAKKINAINVSNWDQVDNQALIFTANGGVFLLVVLERPLETDIDN